MCAESIASAISNWLPTIVKALRAGAGAREQNSRQHRASKHGQTRPNTMSAMVLAFSRLIHIGSSGSSSPVLGLLWRVAACLHANLVLGHRPGAVLVLRETERQCLIARIFLSSSSKALPPWRSDGR